MSYEKRFITAGFHGVPGYDGNFIINKQIESTIRS
jgi:hypothetical protein